MCIRDSRKDGSSFLNQLSIEPVFNPRKEVTHFVGTQTGLRSSQAHQAMDQTPLAFAPVANSESTIREIHQIEEILGVGVFHITEEFQCYYANDNMQKLTGLRDQFIVQAGWLSSIFAEDLKGFKETVNKYIQSGDMTQSSTEQIRIQHPNGKLLYIKTFISSSDGTRESLRKFRIIWLDTTE
mgnify:CR=1 FL=1